jgi:hypothetical protein
MDSKNKFDLFIFGSSSAVIQELVKQHRDYFEKSVRSFHLVQRSETIPTVFHGFKQVTLDFADCSNAERFESSLSKIVSKYAQKEIPMHVFPTYGTFKMDTQAKKPRFEYSRDGFQINLNSRLQVLEAFRPYTENTRFHLFGSLFANFPYMGEYANSMWYINNVVADSENKCYNTLDVVVHNLGGMMTKFWWKAEHGDVSGAFIYKKIPTADILSHGFTHRKKGGEVYTKHPSFISKVASFLGRRGMKPMDHQ